MTEPDELPVGLPLLLPPLEVDLPPLDDEVEVPEEDPPPPKGAAASAPSLCDVSVAALLQA